MQIHDIVKTEVLFPMYLKTWVKSEPEFVGALVIFICYLRMALFLQKHI